MGRIMRYILILCILPTQDGAHEERSLKSCLQEICNPKLYKSHQHLFLKNFRAIRLQKPNTLIQVGKRQNALEEWANPFSQEERTCTKFLKSLIFFFLPMFLTQQKLKALL